MTGWHKIGHLDTKVEINYLGGGGGGENNINIAEDKKMNLAM